MVDDYYYGSEWVPPRLRPTRYVCLFVISLDIQLSQNMIFVSMTVLLLLQCSFPTRAIEDGSGCFYTQDGEGSVVDDPYVSER